MKNKYRIVQDANGIFHIQYRPKSFWYLIDGWRKKYPYPEITDIESARIKLKEYMEKDQKEENEDILTVIK